MRYGYRHTAGVIIVLLVFVIGSIVAAHAQVVTGSPNTPSGYAIDYTTGNLITNGALTSGTGITTNTGSPTWTAYPSPQGSFGVDGYTFSYPTESLGWAGVNLGGINHGYLNSSAVFVTGFNYGLTYRFPCSNSVGTNCDGTSQTAAPANPMQDNLRVEIGYYPATGSNPSFITHQLGSKNTSDGNSAYNPNWQTLAETYTFAAAKPLAQAGAVNMEIVGSDAGGWACIGTECYGPQVKNAYLTVNYSVDPCVLNPAFNPSCAGFSSIIQSWASPTFYYSYNIAQSLPHIGGGVMLHGYDYGFSWWNYGACYASFIFCLDWRTSGSGNINFRVSDKNNTTVLSNQWYVSGDNSGGSYSNRILFTESRNSLDMGSVQWWTSDVYNHFAWYGWTRPIWTPDACYSQPLYSPNCSNFQAEINRIAAELQQTQQASLANVTTASTSPTPTGSVTNTISDAASTNPTVTVVTDTTASKSQSGGSGSTAQALSIIARNQQREGAIASQASQSAMALAAGAAADSQQQAMAVAQNASQNSQTVGTVAVNPVNLSSRNTAQVGQEPAPGSTSVVTQAIQTGTANSANQTTMTAGTSTSTTAIVQFNAMTESAAQPMPVLPMLAPQPAPAAAVTTAVQTYVPPTQTQATDAKIVENNSQQEQFTARSEVQIGIIQPPSSQSTEIAVPMQQFAAITVTPPVLTVDIPVVATNFTTDKTNPVNDIIENRVAPPEPERTTAQTTAVKSNVPDNDAAVGAPTIAAIAVVPVGFSVYSVALADAAFYAPKEIYRNQRTVDNLRALRQLSSDSLHQEMVDQQYRR